ncbi:MAG: chemotaxis protein CheB [Pseudomonadota bacterium]
MRNLADDPLSHPVPDPGPPSLPPDHDRHPVRVLVVEAASASRQLLVELLQADPQIRVVADVADPQAAAAFLQHNHADVVLMDRDGARPGGLESSRRIMETHPLPIVLCTAADGVSEDFARTPEPGAVACIDKPQPGDAGLQADRAARMRLTLKLMSEVKVVRRWSRAAENPWTTTPAPRAVPGSGPVRIIGIGASTGGPPVLQAILADLPVDLGVPILVVQHIAPGFLPGMVQWLRQTARLQVEIGAHGVVPRPGHVYLGPDDCHMGMGSAGRIVTSRSKADGQMQPSVAYLFRTLAEVYGPQAVGVLLSGMGKDGAQELKHMRDGGATTIAQDRETSVVHGMPGEAIALGGATHVLPAHKIAGALRALVPTHRTQET